ncbi:MAG TPA: ATP-binding protein [Actinomycetes bacterium]|jgi:signal transduction histidine kinase|nr:ATP-binding protein [Actinomycetes bacterium]
MDQRPTGAGTAVRAIEYAGLVALVGGTFLVIVVGGGAVLRLDAPHAGLTLAAAALLGLTFEPARQRLRRLANRLLYGHRSSPWEAVSRLAAQMGRDRDPVDQLRELADVVRGGTGARAVVVWLRVDTTWVPAAWSPDSGGGQPAALHGERPPRPPGADLTVAIRHGGELLGAITVTKSGPGSLIPLERRLVTDLASHAGIVTRTLHLQESLRRRVEVSGQRQRELVASRMRLVAAQDAERRRLQRDVHDTCQQQAVVLAGRLGLASALAHRDPHGAHASLGEARADVDRLAATLRRLSRAATVLELVADGIGAALRAHTASLPVTVEIEDLLCRRHHPELAAAVYFCCMEAIQNAVKHASASRIRVRLSEPDGWLAFRVRDDGAGFDVGRTGAGTGLRNMRERLRPWNGQLVVRSSPTGTEVGATIPVPNEVTP